MKKILGILAVIVCVAALPFALAQSSSGSNQLDKSNSIRSPSDLYPITVNIVKIFVHAQGYRVIYQKSESTFADFYVPATWFKAGGKAVMIRVRGPIGPYAVIYYRSDGSFSHVKLYVKDNFKDSTWGTLEGDPGDKFKVDAIKLTP